MNPELCVTKQTWYESQFEAAQLSLNEDEYWLNALSNRSLQQADIDSANRLVARGSISLRGDTDPVLFQHVVQARETFFGQILGWDNPVHPLAKTYEAMKANVIRTMPLATIISSQRLLAAGGVDLARLLSANPNILHYGPDSLQIKLANLTELGFDVAKVINGNNSSVLSLAPETLRAKLGSMTRLGLNAKKMVDYNSNAISLSSASIEKKLDDLNQLGLDARLIFNGSPALLNSKTETIKAKIDYFLSIGLNAIKVVNSCPSALGLAKATVEAKLANLARLGFDPIKIVNSQPDILNLAQESVRAKVNNLTELGIDAIKVVNASPSTLNFAPESVRAKVDNLNELGMNAADLINQYPPLLNYSQESIRSKMRIIERLLQNLGANFSAKELVTDSPYVLGSSTSKLFTIARFVAAHGSPDTLPNLPNTAARLLFLPVHSHVLAMVARRPYSAPAVQMQSKRLPAIERRDEVLRLLSDPAQRLIIGEKCIKAYLRSAPLKVDER